MSCSGTIGELYQLPEDAERGVINQALLKITLNNQLVDYDYFAYIFKKTSGNSRFFKCRDESALFVIVLKYKLQKVA